LPRVGFIETISGGVQFPSGKKSAGRFGLAQKFLHHGNLILIFHA